MGEEVWTGPAPKSEALMAIGPHLSGLHIASHAIYLPDDPLGYDMGPEIHLLRFSTLADRDAKAELKRDILITGLGNYRGLPNAHFREQVGQLRALLKAPPSVGAEQYNAAKTVLHEAFQDLLRTHVLELRHNLLGEERPSGPMAMGVDRAHAQRSSPP